MRLGILFSGGKDSTLALLKASKFHEVVCLITVRSKNPNSFMFHTPNISLTDTQSEALGIPVVSVSTTGKKEEELQDLRTAIKNAKKKFDIKGVVTGALRSTYQASRVQQICHDLGLWCFNPLWLMDQIALLNEVVRNDIHAVISGVFAEGLDASYLGKKIDQEMVSKLARQQNPAGEGGEIETTVLDAPFFKKRIVVLKSETRYNNHSGTYFIQDVRLEEK